MLPLVPIKNVCNMGSHFFGSIFGAIFIIVIACVIYVIIARLFKLKAKEETLNNCFGLVFYFALAISIIVFILNKCSTVG